jgi:hypothetical protein
MGISIAFRTAVDGGDVGDGAEEVVLSDGAPPGDGHGTAR